MTVFVWVGCRTWRISPIRCSIRATKRAVFPALESGFANADWASRPLGRTRKAKLESLSGVPAGQRPLNNYRELYGECLRFAHAQIWPETDENHDAVMDEELYTLTPVQAVRHLASTTYRRFQQHPAEVAFIVADNIARRRCSGSGLCFRGFAGHPAIGSRIDARTRYRRFPLRDFRGRFVRHPRVAMFFPR